MAPTVIASKPARKSASSAWKPVRWQRFPSKPRNGANAGKSSTATETTATDSRAAYIGRFAPTPSGELHLGSLYAAVASYLDARAHAGRWLLRIEDLDRPREVAGSTAGIMHTLRRFGFEWDGPAVRQQDRNARYQQALEILRHRDLIFACTCSRAQLEEDLAYPGICRDRRIVPGPHTALRLRVDAGQVEFTDRIQGTYRQEVASAVGDIVLKRRDQFFAYVLAVVVDDAEQGVNHVVRGADLLDNTPRQIHLQRLLGYAQPAYAHVPVLTEADGGKLAKSRRSVNLRADSPLPQLLSVFSMLGLAPPVSMHSAALAEVWAWAISQWRVANVPKRLVLRVND